jgi:hypothetical protein
MFAQSSLFGILVGSALALPINEPSFTLTADGAVALAVHGREAQFGVVRTDSQDHPTITIALGATSAEAALSFYMHGDRLPAAGRYPVRPHGVEESPRERFFHPCLVAGSVERPTGVFHGESGWVTITRSADGWLAGEFELQARGFLATDLSDEDQWVTVRGRFEARGDSTVTSVASLSPPTR